MSRIIVPSRRVWTRQPQQPTGIDWSNPITRGLVVAWVPSGVFSSQGRLNPTASSGPGVLSPGKFGIGNTFGQTGFELPVSPLDTLKASDQTYLIIGEPPPGTQWNMCITTGSGSFRKWHGDFAIHIYPSTACHLAERWQWTSFGIVVARIRSDKTGRSFIVDNVEKKNMSTEDASAYGNNRTQLFQGANGDRSSETYWANKTFLAVKFDRYLSDKEVKSLTDNPWQIFKPRRRRTIIDLGASGTSSVYSDSALSYYIRSLLSSDSGIEYAIRNAIWRDDEVGYVLRAAVAQNDAVGYVLRQAIAKDDPEGYVIRGLVQASDDEAYNIRGLVQTSDGEAYKIRSQVQADASTSYDIQSSTSVASSNAVNYSVRGSVAASVLVGYSVRGSAQKDIVSAYSVRSAVSRDVVASYSVSAAASSVYADSTASYSVDGVVPSGPSAESIAAAVLTALQGTTIPVDTKKMNGADIVGDGSEANPWRGVGVQP